MSILSQLDNKITLFVYGVFNACKIRVEKVIHRLSTGYPQSSILQKPKKTIK